MQVRFAAFSLPVVALLGVGLGASLGEAQLVVTEVMFDPVSAESRWEWIEVRNAGDAAIDLEGFLMDRVGDRPRSNPSPNITSQVVGSAGPVEQGVVVPAGGVAVLYHGDGLGYDADRFRAAWPTTPAGAMLIGVSGWSSNQLTNAPKPKDYAPGLPAMTVGLWPDLAAYTADVADVSFTATPNRRVASVDHATAAFGYDDDAPWRNVEGSASLAWLGGPRFAASSWGRSNPPWSGASASQETFLLEVVNVPDHGSPGVPPPGVSSHPGLIVTEVMYDPASATGTNQEWEWIELANNGPTLDFESSPLWLDDFDMPRLRFPNVDSGRVGTGETVVLFNAGAASVEQMRAAWDRPGRDPVNWVPVENWPNLANNGDEFGLWTNGPEYAVDLGGTFSFDHALVGFAYDDARPWPAGEDGEAIRLLNLASEAGDPAAWASSLGVLPDPAGYQSAPALGPGDVVDNAGGDRGSPGRVWGHPLPPLPGDYNADGAVDAADYTLWRDGVPLPTETVTAGVTDAADHAVWLAHYGESQSTSASAVPEPTAWLATAVAVAATSRHTRRRATRRRLT